MALQQQSLSAAEDVCGPLLPSDRSSFGVPQDVLVRSDNLAAYPIVEGVPILLAPEVLGVVQPAFDLDDARWAEAYKEMEFYNQESAGGDGLVRDVAAQLALMRGHRVWSTAWLDAPYDAKAQMDALSYMGSPEGKAVLQLGGKGIHAIKALVAGAYNASLVTPMLSEALSGVAVARELGVADRFQAVVGIAEQIPLRGGFFDSVYAGGCVHHMTTEYAAPEIFRVLKVGGRFAAVEPWQTVLHKFGTRLIGKREANAYCRPLNPERLLAMRAAFPDFDVRHHGPVLRYAALAMQKLTKHSISPRSGLRLTAIDDQLPLPRKLGGSVALLASHN